MKLKASALFWDVRFTIPYTHTYGTNSDGTPKVFSGRKNINALVAAESAAVAIQLVESQFSDAQIVATNKKGGSDTTAILVQDDLLA